MQVPRAIDMASFPRRAHFDYFLSLPDPHVGVTVDVDVTALVLFCRAKGCSFTLAFLHAAALAVDAVPELRQRLRNGGVVEYPECPTSHTELKADGTYAYCTLRHHLPLDEYFARAEASRRACREEGGIEEDDGVEGMVFASALPWLRYRDFTQPTGGPMDSNPRLSWGRYEADHRGRLMMPVTLLAHHALVDGAHLAAFYRNLDAELAALTGGTAARP